MKISSDKIGRLMLRHFQGPVIQSIRLLQTIKHGGVYIRKYKIRGSFHSMQRTSNYFVGDLNQAETRTIATMLTRTQIRILQ